MKLYHGSSSRKIKKFSFKNGRKNRDFGKGVYFTTNFEQAKDWSCKRSNTGAVYECDIDMTGFKILSYQKKEGDLIYILYLCRIGLEEIVPDTVDHFEDADAVSGLMLDGNVKHFRKIANKFNAGDISYEEFYEKVKPYRNGYDQICIKSKAALDAINANIRKIYYTQKVVKVISEVEV